jgi:hypothetical protein
MLTMAPRALRRWGAAARAQESAGEVHAEDVLPGVQSEFGERLGGEDPGIVHQHVEPPEASHRLVYACLHLRLRTHVRGHEGKRPFALILLDGLAARFLVRVGNADLVSAAQKGQRDRLADALSPACDQCCLHGSSSCREYIGRGRMASAQRF